MSFSQKSLEKVKFIARPLKPNFENTKYPDQDMSLDVRHLEAIKKYQLRLNKIAKETLILGGILGALSVFSDILNFRVGTLTGIIIIIFVAIRFLLNFRAPRLKCHNCGKKLKKSWQHAPERNFLPAEEHLFLICKNCKLYVPTGIDRE